MPEQLTLDFNPPKPQLKQLWTPDDIYRALSREIVELFREDSRVERKSCRVQQRDLAEYLSMWANTQPHGGIIFIGVEKTGELTGCANLETEALNKLETVRRICPDAKHEFARVPIINSKGREDFVLAIRVYYRPDKLVETTDGEAYIREGDEKRRLNETEKREIRLNKGELRSVGANATRPKMRAAAIAVLVGIIQFGIVFDTSKEAKFRVQHAAKGCAPLCAKLINVDNLAYQINLDVWPSDGRPDRRGVARGGMGLKRATSRHKLFRIPFWGPPGVRALAEGAVWNKTLLPSIKPKSADFIVRLNAHVDHEPRRPCADECEVGHAVQYFRRAVADVYESHNDVDRLAFQNGAHNDIAENDPRAVRSDELLAAKLDLPHDQEALPKSDNDKEEREQGQQTVRDPESNTVDSVGLYSWLSAALLGTLGYIAGVRGRFILGTCLAAWGIFGLLLGFDPVSLLSKL